MTTTLLYLLMVNLVLLIAYASYRLIFSKSPDFRFNRFLLLTLVLASFLIPLLPAQDWFFAKEWNLSLVQIDGISNVSPIASSLIDSEPIESMSSASRLMTANIRQYIPILLYGLVAIGLFFGIAYKCFALIWTLSKLPSKRFANYTLIETSEEIAPFSFFRFIVINPNLYHSAQLKMIMQHEMVHVRQWHNLDILLAELLRTICWINPAAWYLRKAIRQNLEFLADEEVLRKGANRKIYQYSLLALNMPTFNHSALANHFNQSLLKKRIIMMNTNQSSDHNFLKSLFLIPVLGLMLIICQPILAQNHSEPIGPGPDDEDTEYLAGAPLMEGERLFGIIRSNLSMEALKAMQIEFERRGVELKYSNIDFTSEGKISRIRLDLTQWNKSTQTIELNNNGKAIKETVTAFLIHNKAEKTAKIGMKKIKPEQLEDGESYLDKVTGVIIIAPDDVMYMKGELANFGGNLKGKIGDSPKQH